MESSRNRIAGREPDWYGAGQEQVVGTCEPGDKSTGVIKYGEVRN